MLPAELTNSDAQPDSAERRAQIDDFMRLLEAARRAADAGEKFSVALLAPAARRDGAGDDADGSDRPGAGGDSAEAARAAHNFLHLNLRRADSVAFYGPTLLVALLPRRRPRHAHEDLARLLCELEEVMPRARFAFGLASFPVDGADVETLIERADAQLNSALAREESCEDSDAAGERTDSTDGAAAHGEPLARFQSDGDGAGAQAPSPPGRRPEQKSLPLARADSGASEDSRAGASARHTAPEQPHARRGLPTDFAARRAVRESRRGDEFETAVMPYAPAGSAAGGGVLGREASEAAARERERRAAGERMPRRVLLTVSDPARMAQINLLLRSAAYEVRAAFDGGQALDLLRIERADLLVLDYDLQVLDGLSVLRRLHERHRGRLPMPVALLLPPERDSEQLREEARQCGATGLVPLPYDPAQLLECVRTAGSKG